MTLQEAIVQIRRILKDKSDDLVNTQGEFWDDTELVLCINLAQNILCNFALKTKNYHILSNLIKHTTNGVSALLPTDYMHYASSSVEVQHYNPQTSQVNIKISPAKFYTPGEYLTFSFVNHTSATLKPTDTSDMWIEFKSRGEDALGKLHYYKYPTEYTITNLTDTLVDFSDYIYNNIIIPQAAIIAGFKETQTKREIIRENIVLNFLHTTPLNMELLLPDNETAAHRLKPQRQEQ